MPFLVDRLPLLATLLVMMPVAFLGSAADARENAKIWVADALTKVMPDSPVPGASPEAVTIDAVRNEYESAQVVVTALSEEVSVTVELAPVTGPGNPKPRVKAAFLGFVPIRRGTADTPNDHLVARPPTDIPDPILELSRVDVEPGANQPVWVSVFIPAACAPGDYRSRLTIIADATPVEVPILIRVRPITLAARRTLQITNWLSPGNIAAGHDLEIWSEPYWKMLGAYARLMGDYRQNLVRTLLFDLITATEDDQGRLTFDFMRFDRWVGLFEKAGVLGTIEGSHLAYRTDWKTHELRGHRPATTLPDGTQKKWEAVEVSSPEQRGFLSQFLPALVQHLEQMGWRDRYVQHLADEPVAANAPAYNVLAEMVREFAPGIPTIDATMCREVAGAVDIWVPQPSEIDRHTEFFEGRRKLGEKIWIYTCLAPKGRYMNRFIDYPLLSPRLIHWMNFRYGFEGYLHWGLNFWLGDAFTNVERGYPKPDNLPAGDSHIVYPGRYGPLASIRLDAMRDGIEDYELLQKLASSDKASAQKICRSVIRSMTDYTLDPSEFRKTRQRLLDYLEETERREMSPLR